MWSPRPSACAASVVADSGMTQTLVVVVLFVLGMAALPWLVRRVQLRQGMAAGGGSVAALRVLSQVGLGPQQRVVTVQVQHEAHSVVLVLGVTAQQVQCLHVLDTPSAVAGALAPAFATEMARVQESASN